MLIFGLRPLRGYFVFQTSLTCIFFLFYSHYHNTETEENTHEAILKSFRPEIHFNLKQIYHFMSMLVLAREYDAGSFSTFFYIVFSC